MRILGLLSLSLSLTYGTALAIKRANTLPSTYDPSVAQIIYNVGTSLGASSTVMLSAFEAAWVESHCNNLNWGDADSVGVFQQRPSQGWGTTAQLEDPTYAATAYFNAAIKVDDNHPDLDAGDLAQMVQHSAYPDRYNAAQDKAQAIQSDVANNDPDGDEDDDDDDDDTLVDDLDDDGENDYDYDGEDGDEFGPDDDDLTDDYDTTTYDDDYDDYDGYYDGDYDGYYDDGGDYGGDGGDDGGYGDYDGCRKRCCKKRCA